METEKEDSFSAYCCCDWFWKWLADAIVRAVFGFAFISIVLGWPAAICFKLGIFASIDSVWTTLGWAASAAGWLFWFVTIEHIDHLYKWCKNRPFHGVPTVPTSI